MGKNWGLIKQIIGERTNSDARKNIYMGNSRVAEEKDTVVWFKIMLNEYLKG